MNKGYLYVNTSNGHTPPTTKRSIAMRAFTDDMIVYIKKKNKTEDEDEEFEFDDNENCFYEDDDEDNTKEK